MANFYPGVRSPRLKERTRLLAMMGLYFLVLFAVGILRPIRNALALDGLAESEFYKVYLISAVVILFAPLLNYLSDRIQWRTLIPGTAAFFALNLLVFRAVYSEGSGVLGMVFYGWYDLFAAALVTQFFMAVQVFFNARDAKSAVPLVIAAGSFGATLGGLTTGLLAQSIGTPNLMVLAAAFVGVFALAIPFIWTGYPPVRAPGRKVKDESRGWFNADDFVRVFSNRHIRLIAGLVLVTVLVKTLVDYQFNEAVAAYAGDRDAITSFQGYVFGAINWLPIVILLPLGPLLRRWGVGVAVLMLPIVMLGLTAGLAIAFSVWTATLAKAGDATFRYSAERTGREILYVPVPTELKLKAKAYIDMAVEKGAGKAISGLLIFLLLRVVDDYRQVAWVAVGAAAVWCLMAVAAKGRYVTALAESIRARFVNLEDGFASLTERSTLAMVEAALRGDAGEVSFALGLVEQAGSVDARHLEDELELLLDHPEDEVRIRVLRLLERFSPLGSEAKIRGRLADKSDRVREAAVGALAARRTDEEQEGLLFRELLESTDAPVRIAALSWLQGSGEHRTMARSAGAQYLARILPDAGSEEGLARVLAGASVTTRREAALALALVESNPMVPLALHRLMADQDPTVAAAAIRSAGRIASPDLWGPIISRLGDPALRAHAKEALVPSGGDIVELCGAKLADPNEEPAVRRNLPWVLARIDDPRSVQVLQDVVADRNVSQDVRYQTLKALNRLRAKGEGSFDRSVILAAVAIEVAEAERYVRAGRAIDLVNTEKAGHGVGLLRVAVQEAWEDRGEVAFRLLGLVFPPDEVYRSHLALSRPDERQRANAVEWLEGTLGYGLFNRILPVLPTVWQDGSNEHHEDLETVLVGFGSDPDPWLASVAAWNQASGGPVSGTAGEDPLDVIEKIFLLQKVDLLQGARSSHLGLLAAIAEEVDVESGEELLRSGEPSEALYVIVRGAVELSGVGDRTLSMRDGEPFGGWSLIDRDPSVVTARAVEPTRLIRITRGDFQELLADHPELATGILQALARRVRSLVA